MSNNPTAKSFFLIPSGLGETSIDKEIAVFNKEVLEQIEVLWVENPKPARAYIKSCETKRHISEFDIRQIAKQKNDIENINEIVDSLKQKTKVGFMSDAGLPCIADPGAVLVNLAREENFKIIPLVGASSIMLGLMASGFNGQQFTFHGYLPIKDNQLNQTLKRLETEVLRTGYTQIFIETPYRNDKMLNTLLSNLNPEMYLCIASNILQDNEIIQTLKISDWKKKNFEIGKVPSIFLIGIKQ